MESEVVHTKNCGSLNVYYQGVKNAKVAFLTVHDLGCNQFVNFLEHDSMEQLKTRFRWIHVDVPGQGDGESDLPGNYNFPKIQALADGLVEVCDYLGLKNVILFGEGAGANIIARVAMVRHDIVLGAILVHCTGTTASVAESLRDKIIGWKLNTVGMNPAAESYLLMHRFGNISKTEDEIELKHILSEFRKSLRQSINPKNLNKFITAFMARTKIIDNVHKIKCPTLFLTGSLASHNQTVFRFYNALRATVKNDPSRKTTVELVQLDDVANVLRSQPNKVADCVQYFIQGLGLGSGIVNRRMSGVIPFVRARTFSMEEYDQPKGVAQCLFDRTRKYSTAGDIPTVTDEAFECDGN